MNRITRIKGENLKGHTFAHDLAPITIFTGPTGAGKTSRILAIKLALLGYDPDPLVGRRPQDIMRLASGNTLYAWAQSGDHATWHRWERNASGGASHDQGGDMIDVALVALDPAAYFALSPAKQVDYIFANTQVGDDTGNAPAALVARLEQIEADTESKVEARRDMITDVERIARGHESVNEMFDKVVDHLKQKATEHSAEVKRMKGTVTGVAQLRTVAASKSPAAAKAELDKITVKGQELAKKVGELQARIVAADSNAEEVRKARLVIDTLGGGDLDAKLARLDEESVEPAAPDVSGIAAIESEIGRASGRIEARKKQIADIKGMKECPTCGAKTKGWKTSKIAELELSNDGDHFIIESKSTELHGLKTLRDLYNQRLTASKEARDAAKLLRDAITWLAKSVDDPEALKTELADVIKKRAECRDEYVKASDAHREAIRIASDTATAAKAEQELEKAEAALEITKAAQAVVAGFKSEIVTRVVGGLLASANTFTAGVLRTPLAYVGSIGRVESGTFIPGELFSDGEKAVLYAAMSAAIGAHAGNRVVIVDGLGHMDTKSKMLFMDNVVARLKAGEIDQFIGTDFDPSHYVAYVGGQVGNDLSIINVGGAQ